MIFPSSGARAIGQQGATMTGENLLYIGGRSPADRIALTLSASRIVAATGVDVNA
jgi:hypothetical protein